MEEQYRRLKARWLAGERDRELCLQLMFFAWMHWADPSFVTGLSDDSQATELWHRVFIHLGGENSIDAEFLFVGGTMANLFPYVLGNEVEWKMRGLRMVDQAMKRQAEDLPLSTFTDRGQYGKYFAHQLTGHLRETRRG